METQNGPSKTSKSIKRKELADIEDEIKSPNKNTSINNSNKTFKAQSQNELTDSEDDDILQVKIDNEYFGTPNKKHQHTQNTLFGSKPNASNRTHTFKTPTKQTNTIAESLTSTVEQIFKITIQNDKLLSPLKKTPIHNVRSHQFVTPVTTTPTHKQSTAKQNLIAKLISRPNLVPLTHTPSSAKQRVIPKHNSQSITHTKPYNQQPHTQSASIQKKNVERKGISLAQYRMRAQQNQKQAVSLAQHQVDTKQNHAYTINNIQSPNHSAHKYKSKQTAHTNTRFQPYSVATHTSTHKQNPAFNYHSHTYTQNKAADSQCTFVRTQSLHKNSHNHTNQYVSNTVKQKETTSFVHTPTQTHTRTSESLLITISNTEQLNKNTENRSVVEEPQTINSRPEPPNTKIITLNNKYAPAGVRLAIAVEKNKKLSKNALKRITRNLASQLE